MIIVTDATSWLILFTKYDYLQTVWAIEIRRMHPGELCDCDYFLAMSLYNYPYFLFLGVVHCNAATLKRDHSSRGPKRQLFWFEMTARRHFKLCPILCSLPRAILRPRPPILRVLVGELNICSSGEGKREVLQVGNGPTELRRQWQWICAYICHLSYKFIRVLL